MATKTKAKSKTVAKKAAPQKAAKKTSVKKTSKTTNKSNKPAAKAAKKVQKPVKTTAVKKKPAAKAKPVAKTLSKPAAKTAPAKNTVATGAKKSPATKAQKFTKGGAKGTINGTRKSALPERAPEIPTRTVKMQQPKIKTTKQDPNKTRYSDSELQEFRKLIEEKLEAAKTELRYLQDQINRKDDNGTDDTENKFANLEDGSITMEREYLNQMAVRQAQYIDHLEKALIRIQNKTYGICRVTGKLIDKERLRAVPHATLSMEAKLMQNR